MPPIQRTAQAAEDLIGIWLYIARDDVRAADRLLDEIEDKFQLLADQPALGRARPDIAPAFRYLPVRRYPIPYRPIKGIAQRSLDSRHHPVETIVDIGLGQVGRLAVTQHDRPPQGPALCTETAAAIRPRITR